MKKIIFIIICFILVLVIFKLQNNDIYYLNLNSISNNDYSIYYKDTIKNLKYYNNNFNIEEYRITDLIRDIKENKEITINNKKQTIENSIIKADIITIWIGMNEIKYKINSSPDELYNYSDQLLTDMEELFILLRKYSKEEIIFLNFYSPTNNNSEVITYLNKKLEIIASEYNIKILDISKIIKNNPTDNDYKTISNMLKNNF